MKKSIVLTAAFALCTCLATAQERTIKMPEEGGGTSKIFNTAQADKGYWCSVEAAGGSTLMEGRKNVAMAEVSFTNGYRFSEFFKVGVGIGALYYINNSNVRCSSRHLAMPLYLNARGNMLTDAIRGCVPYWSVDAGAVFPDGLFLAPTVGLRVGDKRSAFLVGIGYSIRQIDAKRGADTGYSGASLRIGYEF